MVTTARFATPDSHRAVAPKYAYSERQAAAVSQEAVDEAREGPMLGLAEVDIHVFYKTVVITKAVLHLQEAAALSSIIYREHLRDERTQDAKVIGMALFAQGLEARQAIPGNAAC
jgi:hypothetical protein|tara:strand:+ start:103 stop:447 length:345 start_codon:yes stop_codon:yes gene_type:complete